MGNFLSAVWNSYTVTNDTMAPEDISARDNEINSLSDRLTQARTDLRYPRVAEQDITESIRDDAEKAPSKVLKSAEDRLGGLDEG